MAQAFHLFHKEPTVTSSPTEVHVWIEELDYSFLVYGGNFERAEINGEKLFNITRQKLKELGIILTVPQDIILKAVTIINTKNKVEEQAMQGQYQNDKKMTTRFTKESELLEHAIDQVLGMISERRMARTIHGTNEQPLNNIRTAALELITVVKMILNILERPPLDVMSEFSSVKNHLIKHITLLKYYSEQSDLNNEMESDMIDACKDVTKLFHYIIALPPKLTKPEEMAPWSQVPIAIEPEAMSFSVEHEPDSVAPTQHLSVPITVARSPRECVSPLQDMRAQNKIVPYRSEYFCPERLNTLSNEGTLIPHDEGNESETAVSGTKGSETLAGSLDCKSLQDLLIIESDFNMSDSGSEKGVIDSDSDRVIALDFDLEKQWKDSDSVIWGMNSDSETCPVDSDSMKHPLEEEKYQTASGSVKGLKELEQHLLKVEQFQVDFDSQKYWTDSDSEKCLKDSDSEKYFMDSDHERPEIDSESEKFTMASPSVKQVLKAEKCLMASDSIKYLMKSKRRLIEVKEHWILSASEKDVIESDMEKNKISSASASGVHLMGKEKHQKKTRPERYAIDSDSEPCGVDPDSERHTLATTAAKCLMGTKTYLLSTNTEGCCMDSSSERHTIDLGSESLGIDSDSMKHMMMAESCQSESEFKRFWIDLRSESEKSWTDSEKQQLDSEYNRCWDTSRRYQHRSARFQSSSERCQVDFRNHWDNFERHQRDSNSKKHQANSENGKYKNEFESERHTMEMEREQCPIQFENERLQMGEDQEKYHVDSDGEKEHQIQCGNKRLSLDSENEAQWLGARKKENRPHDFWRPVFLSTAFDQAKKTEGKPSVKQTGNKGTLQFHMTFRRSL